MIAQRLWSRLVWPAVLVVAAFGVTLALGRGAQLVSNLALTVAPLAAATACLLRGLRLTGRERWGWLLIGAGVLSWGLGQVAYFWLETFGGAEQPFPSIADIGYLGLVPLTPIGLLVLPSAAQSLANRARSVLDGLMVAVSLILIAWLYVLAPQIDAGADSTLALTISLTYPLGDVVIVTIVVYMLARQRRQGGGYGPLALVGVGMAAFAVSDILYAYLNLTGAYLTGGVTDTGWFTGFMLILLAALKPGPTAAAGPRAFRGDGSQPVGVLLPYAAVLVALICSVVWLNSTGQNSAFVSWARSLLILLIVGRQLLTLLENRDLTRNLEGRVASRTAELYASEQRFQALVQHSSDVVTVVRPDGVIIYQSASMARVFGHPALSMEGKPVGLHMDDESRDRIAAALAGVAAAADASITSEIRVRHADGTWRQAEMTVTNLLADPSVGGLVLNTRDISERKVLQDQLVHEAYHDTLTQLANRALYRDQVGEALARRAPDGEVSVLFLDLDGFKEVNDSLGHHAGDQLLMRVADRLRASVRAGDVLARFGGDEFAVLIEAPLGAGEAEAVAARIVAGLGRPFHLGDREIHVRVSVGLAATGTLDEDAAGAEQLMRNADLAMYRAKASGGNTWLGFHPDMLAGLMERLELETDLRAALDRGELELHYQPTVDLAADRVVGFEALIRWRHPVRGLIGPAGFVPIAESTGLIVQLGRWVLTEACHQAVAWSARAGRPVRMAVNVSVRQFDRLDLAGVVAEALAATGMPAPQLCLEMTESVLMTDTEENLAQLVRLKALGVTLAIDDFGTGYSSLAYLRRFPVDTLKIDRSFVESLGDQTDDAALASTIVQLGRNLGMSTVAEGIEDAAQLAALRAMGCDYAQGYYFSRPLPAAEAAELLFSPAGAATGR